MVENTFNSPAYVREEIQGETYDKENTTIRREGKDINLYDYIQDSREDTEIYPTLEKYGSVKPIELNAELVYGDMGHIKNLRDLKEAENASLELWNALPLQVRNEFENNRYNFMKNGEKWLKQKIELAKQQQTPTTTEEGVKENG